MIRDSELEDVRDQINSAGESSLEALKENVIHPNEIEGIEYLEDDWPDDEDVLSAANIGDSKNAEDIKTETSSPAVGSDETADDAKKERSAS